MFTEELAHLHAHIKLFNKESTTSPKKVTKTLTVCKVLSEKPTSKNLDITLVSAFAERCFSVMRRIKTWLRSNMRDSPIDRMFSNIHKNMFDNINLQAVADGFASKKNTNKLFWVTCAAFNN